MRISSPGCRRAIETSKPPIHTEHTTRNTIKQIHNHEFHEHPKTKHMKCPQEIDMMTPADHCTPTPGEPPAQGKAPTVNIERPPTPARTSEDEDDGDLTEAQVYKPLNIKESGSSEDDMPGLVSGSSDNESEIEDSSDDAHVQWPPTNDPEEPNNRPNTAIPERIKRLIAPHETGYTQAITTGGVTYFIHTKTRIMMASAPGLNEPQEGDRAGADRTKTKPGQTWPHHESKTTDANGRAERDSIIRANMRLHMGTKYGDLPDNYLNGIIDDYTHINNATKPLATDAGHCVMHFNYYCTAHIESRRPPSKQRKRLALVFLRYHHA